MKSILMSAVLLAFASPAFAHNVVCQGRVQIPSWGSDSDVGLNFDQLKMDAELNMWNPITDDEDASFLVQIWQLDTQKDGSLNVFAQYEREEASHLTFTYVDHGDGTSELRDFKGVEGTVEYGPTTIQCKTDKE